MKPEDFNLLSTAIKDRSGLALTPEKTYLLESRLMPIARRLGLKDLGELAKHLRSRRDEKLLDEIAEAMTTNESFFFRDAKPFTQFADVILPKLLAGRATRKHIRIWCAACSSGQEPYSLAMILKNRAAQLAGWKIDIVATDISPDILQKAKVGQYTQFEVQRGLPIEYLVKYFEQTGETWQIDPSIRSMVSFRELNLLKDLSSIGSVDVVFCRNVLIYFDQPTKAKVLEGISRLMPPDGTLYLGGAESVIGVSRNFMPLPNERGVYTPTDSPPTAVPAPASGRMASAAVGGT